MGWRVLVIWECSIRGKSEAELSLVLKKCCRWIESSTKYKQIK
jgi:G:T-mismatch repair DNA endonuclease (very short patch repair protein)